LKVYLISGEIKKSILLLSSKYESPSSFVFEALSLKIFKKRPLSSEIHLAKTHKLESIYLRIFLCFV